MALALGMPEGLSTGLRVRLIGQAVIAAYLPWEHVAVVLVERCDLTMVVGGEKKYSTSKVLLAACFPPPYKCFFLCSAFSPIVSLPAPSHALNDNYLVGHFLYLPILLVPGRHLENGQI